MGKSAIKSHANTQIHTKNAGTISLNLVQQNIEPLFSSASKTAVIDAGIMMAVFVVEHNLAFQIMGHLPQFVNKITPDLNIAKKVKCSRTKMVNILRNVLGISDIEEIVDLLNANKFSLIIDESTDISLVKTLCLVVRVYASSLFSAVINSFTKNNIMYKQNMIGFTADGANVMMESSQIHKLHSSVKEIVVTLLECFVRKDYITMFLDSTSEFNLPPECLLDLESIYLGIKVECFLITNEINVIEIDTFKNKCRNFYIEAILQILKRFDLNNFFFRNLSIIAPDNVYACTYKSIASLLQQVPRLLADNIQEIDSEYRTLINFVKDKEQILDIEEFWRMVARIEIGNEQAFPNLVKLVFAILSFPHSSANVERVFSQVNLMKTKIRNRLENATIKACLQTKGLLKLQNSDCTNFKVTTEMRKKCNKAMYDIPK
ncbi:unnamed protein product [Hermetia illucens]|uniref:HAT C-terminal dimerisation domain-containing protein n=1 Tax=Hermetia illucens TaxID=343691 RepID=A0A7R8V582_HERIL|nr:unnamed protein product [Hermetia illucens]